MPDQQFNPSADVLRQPQSKNQVSSNIDARTKITNDVSTIEYQNNSFVKSKSKKHPGFKQFDEPGESVDQNTGRFQPTEKIQKNNFTVKTE